MEDCLFDALDLQEGAKVLDAGCGHGHVALHGAQRGLVIGIGAERTRHLAQGELSNLATTYPNNLGLGLGHPNRGKHNQYKRTGRRPPTWPGPPADKNTDDTGQASPVPDNTESIEPVAATLAIVEGGHTELELPVNNNRLNNSFVVMAAKQVDRQATTPFLLKLFYRASAYHNQSEFLPSSPTPAHLQIYTWPTCSLRELTHLLTTALPSLLPDPVVGTRLTYRLFFPDMKDFTHGGRARYTSKELGSVVVGEDLESTGDAEEGTNGATKAAKNLSGDADKTLQDVRFVIGDYVAVSIWAPLPNGEVAPVPSLTVSASGRGGAPPSYRDRDGRERERSGILGPPRENGYGGGGYGRPRGGRYGGSGSGDFGSSAVPPGEWRRGDMPPGPGGYGRGRTRGRGW
ncbi:hypothetical protein NA57DRAFT_70338 [Rhizodiscina lignyota]|uniref:S-adenosyl-L-methionine-dependent methyltransferase n=1 Tax=Rhizodiscina lignyota TaxID=1504668 RepID=A0A9P4MAX9_9PEZI|nr:hypothetical protein NA57DRAFT_70338 [Rhizodiscina lignyota]